MCSRFLNAFVILLLLATSAGAEQLKVCADPANLPFSNSKRQGFDNRVAELLARELDAKVEYHWSRVGRGFVRNVVNGGACDVLVGVPVGMRGLQIAAPYYRSSYVFVTRRAVKPIKSFDDPRLRDLKVGVQVLDEDYAPPGRALARRELTQNLVGFEMSGKDDGAIIRAVARKKIDVAVVWGPLAGFYANQYGNQLRLTPVEPAIDPPALAFAFDMGIGVRKDNPELFAKIQNALQSQQQEIRRVLRRYGVPLERESDARVSSARGGRS
jgi:mxaJ protein